MKTLIALTMFLLSFNFVNAQWLPTVTAGMFPWCNPIKLITKDNKFILASQACNVIMSTDSGANWTPIHNGIPLSKYPTDIVLKDTILFLSVFDTTGSIYSSTDQGNTWTLMNNGLPSNIYISVLSICGNNIFAGTSNGVYLSSNNGNLWTQVNNGLPLNAIIHSIAYDGYNIYVGTYRNGIYFSNNNGNSWNDLNNGLPPNLFIYAINKNGNNILISTRDSASSTFNLYLSVNSGNSWNLANNGMPTNTAVKSFISYGTNIFAGVADTSGTNVYLTANSGGLWTNVGDGLREDGFVFSVVSNFVILGDYIYASVDSLYPFKRLLSEMVSVKENFVNNIFSIFPNPSTGKLTILKNSNLKNIEIFNILGNVIYYSTFNKYQTSKEIDLSDLPKGIYFVKADNGELTHVEKIIIN